MHKSLTGNEHSRSQLISRVDTLGWKWRAMVFAAVLYGPYSWMLIIDYPWNAYRLLWIKMWLALPCFVPATLLRRVVAFEIESVASVLVMSLLGMGLVVMLTRGTKNQGLWLVLAAATVFLYSTVSAVMLYHAFRA